MATRKTRRFGRYVGCWLADVLGLTETATSTDAGVVTGAGEGATRRWLVDKARQHVAKCARCQAEQATWERVVARLRTDRHVLAPPSLYTGVMAKIAQSSAAEAMNKSAGRHRASSNRRALSLGSTTAWFMVLGSVGLGAWLKHASMVDGFSSVGMSFYRLVLSTGYGVTRVIEMFRASLPPAAEPLVSACLWGAAGWGLTVGVLSTLERVSKRL